MAGLKAHHSQQPKVIEILDSDSDDDDSATDKSDRGDDSDVQLIIPAARVHVKAEAESQPGRRIPTNSDSSNSKRKGKERAVEPLIDPSRSSRSVQRDDLVGNAYSADYIDPAGSSTRIRHNLASSSHSAGLFQAEDYDVEDEDTGTAYARQLYEELNGSTYIDGDRQFPLLPLSKRKRSSSSTPSGESDSQLAARLAHEEEVAEARRKELEESDALYAKTVYAADELAERVRREKLEKTGEKVEKIAYQVTMDGDGKTIEGDEDAENMNQ
jgi:hypothetical protein